MSEDEEYRARSKKKIELAVAAEGKESQETESWSLLVKDVSKVKWKKGEVGEVREVCACSFGSGRCEELRKKDDTLPLEILRLLQLYHSYQMRIGVQKAR